MDESRLSAIKARVVAAAPGPWAAMPLHRECDYPATNVYTEQREVCGHASDVGPVAVACEADFANAAFVAHAREDVPDLVAEVERLTAELDALADGAESVRLALLDCVRIATADPCDSPEALATPTARIVAVIRESFEALHDARDRAIDGCDAARREGAEAVRDAAMSVADDLAGGTPEASDAEWAHELMHRVAAAVAKVSAPV